MTNHSNPRPTKAERTAAAREEARRIREAQAKKEKRNSWLIRGGVLVAAVVIVVVVALVIIQTQKGNEPVASSGPVPANVNTFGGVTVGKNGAILAPTTTVASVDQATLPPAPTAQPTAVADASGIGVAASAAGKPVQIVAYIDFMCPHCQAFEAQFSTQLKQWEDAGKVTVEYRPLGLLDQFSTTNYSSRAAAAAACVAATSPEKWSDFMNVLFQNQPAENGPGLDNAKLAGYATQVGAKDVTGCVDAKTYRPFVKYATALAVAHGVVGTPTVFVDGKQWQNGDFKTFAQGIIDAKK
ncbi:DsbA family protein [Specibacter cremeus]|uniref:DsbA family protein n=1 Tax=Specibacter cremeus TaxID=1629051 RepID=UPI000F78EB7D|nr:thioredoxin domain-containing protein [Specibacter cremeus]